MRVMGIILTGAKSEKLKELTETKSISVLPIGGTYRIIDFSISNMKNSGIEKVAVITQYNSRSVREHVNSSRWWDFGRKHGGLKVFTPFLSEKNKCWYKGTIDAIYQNMEYLKNSNEAYVVLVKSEIVLKIDYNEALEYHINNNSDITLIVKKDKCEKKLNIFVDENYRVIKAGKKLLDGLQFMGMFIISRRKLIELIEETIKLEKYENLEEIIIEMYKKNKVMTYLFEGYSKEINTIQDYYSCNMDFLNEKLRRDCFRNLPRIRTKIEDEPPAKFNPYSNVQNSICSGGCIINGEIKNSIINRRVYVGNNTVIKNSIIFNDVIIGNNCNIENYIIDSKTKIPEGSRYINETKDKLILSMNKSYYL